MGCPALATIAAKTFARAALYCLSVGSQPPMVGGRRLGELVESSPVIRFHSSVAMWTVGIATELGLFVFAILRLLVTRNQKRRGGTQ